MKEELEAWLEKRRKEYLVLKPMFLPAVLLDLGVDVLHQGVPLHQHVREGGAREDPHNLHSTPSDTPREKKDIKLKSQSTNNWNGHTECQWSLEW